MTYLSRLGLRNADNKNNANNHNDDPDNGIKEWCRALENRFRESPGKSLSLLENLRYTVADARNKKDLSEYMAAVVLNGQNAGIAKDDASKVLLAYKYIDAVLRQNLSRPSEILTITSLLEEIRYVKDIWFDIYGSSTAKAIDKPSRLIGNQNPGQYSSNLFRRQNNSYPVGAGNQLNAGNDGYGYGYGSNEGIGYSRAPGLYNDNPNPRQRPWLPWDQYVNSQYNTNRRQNIYQTPPPPTTEVQQRQLPGGRQQLQITSGASENQSPGEIRNGRQTDGQGQPNRQAGQNAYGGRRFNNRNPFNRNDRQPAQTRAYHNSTVHKYEAADVPVYASTAETQGNEIPYNDHEDFRRYEESFYSNTDWSGQYTEPETHMQYEDTKDLAEECVETHFCKASKSVIRYRNCQAVFQSNNQLHRHLKDCQGTKSTAATKASSVQGSDTGRARVIKSSASDIVVDGYRFRGYRYATALVALTPTGDKYKLYLNSGCTISLIDKKFILNHGIPI